MNTAVSPASNQTQVHPFHRTVSWEVVCIVAICMADLATTLYWVSQGQAQEGNPIMAWVLNRGHIPFIAVKILTFTPAVILAEWHRHERPHILRLMRWAIALYLFLYVSGVACHYGRVLEFYRRLLLS